MQINRNQKDAPQQQTVEQHRGLLRVLARPHLPEDALDDAVDAARRAGVRLLDAPDYFARRAIETAKR